MKAVCVLDDKDKTKVCDLELDKMPSTHCSFVHNKKEYMILRIKKTEITVKQIQKRSVKK